MAAIFMIWQHFHRNKLLGKYNKNDNWVITNIYLIQQSWFNNKIIHRGLNVNIAIRSIENNHGVMMSYNS